MTRPNRLKGKSIYLWHRYTGLLCAALVIVLSVTGLLLQHGESLRLTDHYLKNPGILRYYGIKPNPITSFKAGHVWLSHAGKHIYMNDTPLASEYNILLGAIETKFGFALVADQALLLIDENGEIIEKLSEGAGLPQAALGIGSSPAFPVVVRGSKNYWLPDESFLHWKIYEGPHPVWITAQNTPAQLTDAIRVYDVQHTINWERLLLDLHSGRLLGRYGFLIMDAAAIGLLLLAFSGIWVWAQRRRKYKEHGHKH